MTLLEKLFAAGRALKAGESLQHLSAWKNTQALMGPILILLAVVEQFMGFPVSDSQNNAIALGIATFGVLFNTYLTMATTKKIGLPNKNKDGI